MMVLLGALHASLLGVLLSTKHTTSPVPTERLMLVSIKPPKISSLPLSTRTLQRRDVAQVIRNTSALPRFPGSGSASIVVGEQLAMASAPEAASALAPLNLSLPPSNASTSTLTKRNPALSDPRSNSVRRTLNDRIAASLGSKECTLEEQLADGTTQHVSGHYESVPTASSQADPFGHGSSTGRGFGAGASLSGGMRGTTVQAGGGGSVAVCIPDRR
ncbi:hypothetical protein LNV09_23045 [Paucibacter sp. B2R-40]|uniref:hypothetical protein n=1 Tax=Paucibacter sp. B2R-40 TaxID=2893554 RepID=UPI0021E42080|nr:hypothetical protein [Paucibacter sp. B2R-40]MCV2357031.1 hypothetical protein [Paucibacter sp. B2R-40]